MSGGFRAPLWTPAILLVLAAGPALVFESAFGSLVGLIAALGGFAVGLGVAWLSRKWSWDGITTIVVLAAVYLLLGGVFALRETTIAGFIPTLTTLRTLILGIVSSWRDLLTVHLPAAGTTGPAVVPWVVGLFAGVLSGLLTIRWNRPLLGAVPLLVFAVAAVAWGPGGFGPAAWPSTLWVTALLAWLAWCAQHARIGEGREVVLGRRSKSVTGEAIPQLKEAAQNRSIRVVHAGRRVLAAVLTLAVAAGIAHFSLDGRMMDRTVLRDLVEPPLELHDYASPLSSFRHYTTDLADEPMVTVSELPSGARVRVGVMDVWDGITFNTSDPLVSGDGRYLPTAGQIQRATDDSHQMELKVDSLVGPWMPSVGDPQEVRFTSGNGKRLAEGLHVNAWAGALLTTTAPRTWSGAYELSTTIPPTWSDGQLAGVPTAQMGEYVGAPVPDVVREFGLRITASEGTALAGARAIERHLSKEGFYSSADTPQSRPGHRADRLIRMLELDELIGDDEQYAALMALMLQSQGIPARVVMGYYPEEAAPEGTEVVLRGRDAHVWVEVPFEDLGWAVFDPTPPKNQQPQTDVPEPRSVPRPQVLQPPEPPEPPVELPPNVTDRDVEDRPEPETPLPWGLILGIGGGLATVLVPILVILALKALRTRRRRKRQGAAAVRGAWAETVDLAVDAGSRMPAHLTRTETAERLATTFHETLPEKAPAWNAPASEIPPIVALTRRADAADFSGAQIPDEEAEAAWEDVAKLRKDLSAGTSAWVRWRRRLSLRSLVRRSRRRQRRRARRSDS